VKREVGKGEANVKKPRVYADTSVIGGCLDEEFAADSMSLVQRVRDDKMILLLSDLLADELAAAPRELQELLAGLPAGSVEQVLRDEESEQLRDAYLRARVVGASHAADAHHIALATVARADLLELQAHRALGEDPMLQCGEPTARLSIDRDPHPKGGRLNANREAI